MTRAELIARAEALPLDLLIDIAAYLKEDGS